MKLLSFGEVLWDVYPDNAYIGGAPLNFAAHFAKLGGDVQMLSAIGDDELGKKAVEKLQSWGVGTDFITVTDKETGKCLVTLDEKFVPSYNLLNNVAWDYINCNDVPKEFDGLYFGTLALRSEYNFNSLKKLLETHTFAHVFVDVNVRKPFYNRTVFEFALQNATILKISDEELPTILKTMEIDVAEEHQAVAKKLSELYPQLTGIIITLGEKGAYAFDCVAQQECSCPAVKIQAVSSVGAGDSFSASFLSKYLKGESPEDSLRFASKVAAFVVSHHDAVPDYTVDMFE